MRHLLSLLLAIVLLGCSGPLLNRLAAPPTPTPDYSECRTFGLELLRLHQSFEQGTEQYNERYHSLHSRQAPKADVIRLHHAEWQRLDKLRLRVAALEAPPACAHLRDDYSESLNLAQRVMEEAIVYVLLGDRDIGEMANDNVDLSRSLRECAVLQTLELLGEGDAEP